jgi:hypothetical protein
MYFYSHKYGESFAMWQTVFEGIFGKPAWVEAKYETGHPSHS